MADLKYWAICLHVASSNLPDFSSVTNEQVLVLEWTPMAIWIEREMVCSHGVKVKVQSFVTLERPSVTFTATRMTPWPFCFLLLSAPWDMCMMLSSYTAEISGQVVLTWGMLFLREKITVTKRIKILLSWMQSSFYVISVGEEEAVVRKMCEFTAQLE